MARLNPRLTDRERCLVLEAQVAQLEEELEAWRSSAREEAAEALTSEHLGVIRRKLKRAWPLAGGLQPALILIALMARPGRPLSRSRLFTIMRTPKSWVTEENNRSLVAVRLCHLRRALDNLGLHGVIENTSDAGWSISPANCAIIRAAIFPV